MAATKHIAIIGGGVIGLCTALYAVKAGHRVTLVERGKPDHDSCSTGNAGLITPSHVVPLASPGMASYGLKMMWKPDSPFQIKPRLSTELIKWCWKFYRSGTEAHVNRSAPLLRDLGMASRACFEELDNESKNSLGLVKRGTLMLCRQEPMLQKEVLFAEKVRQLGLAADVLSPEEVTKLEPNIKMDVAGAVFFPEDCHLSPNQFIAYLTEYLQNQGVRFIWAAQNLDWKANSNEISAIQIEGKTIEADEYVLAAGSWSSKIARRLGIPMPLQAGRGYSLTLKNPSRSPEISCLLMEARVAVTPMDSSLRFAGTMEIAGLNSDPNPTRFRNILKAVPGYFPQLDIKDFQAKEVWSGMRPCSPDGLPYVGRIKRYSNLSAAAGHAMMGLALGPITGKIMASILSDENPEFDLHLLEPERFS